MASQANFSCFNSNVSRDFLTEEVWSLNPVVQTDTGTRYTLTAIVVLLMLIGVPSNALVIGVVLWRRLYQQQPTILLLLNLSVTDLMVCLLVMPWNIVALIAGEFSFGEDDHTRCQVCQTGVIFVILSLVTLNTLAVISVDRLIYLRAPLNYQKLVTHTRVLLATILTWLLSTILAIPPLFGFNEMRFSTAVGICTIAFSGSTHLGKNSNYLIMLAAAVLFPIATLIVTNFWGLCIIQRHLRKKSTELKKDKLNHRHSFLMKLKKQQQSGQAKLVKLYTAIFITNLITYIPMVARMITGVVAEEDEFTEAVRISGSLAYMALMSQAVVHPIVQASLIGDVRRGITAQLHSVTERVRKKSRTEFSQSSMEDSYNYKRNGHCSLEKSEQLSNKETPTLLFFLDRNWTRNESITTVMTEPDQYSESSKQHKCSEEMSSLPMEVHAHSPSKTYEHCQNENNVHRPISCSNPIFGKRESISEHNESTEFYDFTQRNSLKRSESDGLQTATVPHP